MYFTQVLHQRAQTDPDQLFSVCRGEEFTVAQTIDRVSRIGGWLRQQGVKKDDRVALLDLNTNEFLQGALAICWADGIVVPVNYRWPAVEIVYSLREADVEILIVSDAFLALAEEVRAEMPELKQVLHLGAAPTPEGIVSLAEALKTPAVPDAERGGESTFGIFYTGGTTGLPKGVLLSHRGVIISSVFSAVGTGQRKGGSHLIAAPAFHMAAMAAIVTGMILEQSFVMLPEFSPVETMRTIQDHKVTQTVLVPTMIQMVVDHPDQSLYDLSSLMWLSYGAVAISESLLDRAREVFAEASFTQVYGMTELSPSATLLSDEDHAHPERRKSGGRAAFHSMVVILDEHDRELPRGEIGEICVKGEHVMQGYWKQPEQTAEALRNGWMHTGDMGYMDDDGYVYVVDRLKDMIISGGENVYSLEVENVIAKHPAVMQCAVIGVPDEKWGERVHAVVQLRAGAELTASELRDFCKQKIAGYKAPQTMEVVEAWPLSAAGKILKRDLREARTRDTVESA